MSKPPTRTWSGATKAPAVKRKRCHLGCGAHVDEFRESYGHVVRLDTQPPTVDVDLAEVAARLYEYRGPRIGWVAKFLPERGWRELRLVHQCAGSTRTSTRTSMSTSMSARRRTK